MAFESQSSCLPLSVYLIPAALWEHVLEIFPYLNMYFYMYTHTYICLVTKIFSFILEKYLKIHEMHSAHLLGS